MTTGKRIRLFRRQQATRVLGPGVWAVLWVQGCGLGCPGCLVPESWPDGGEEVPVGELLGGVMGCPGIEELTLSGGEPTQQAEALRDLIDGVRARADLGVMCYTGHRYEHLARKGTPAQRALLGRVDLLVDGPYVRPNHADLLWRGSSNQRLLALTERYRALIPEAGSASDRGEVMSGGWEPPGQHL